MPAEGDLLFLLLFVAFPAVRALLLTIAWLTALSTGSPDRREVAYRLVCLMLTLPWHRGDRRDLSRQ